MHLDRLDNIKILEEIRQSNVIVYFTSDRVGLETQIADDILPIFSDHLDLLDDVKKISLFLYTRGGSTLTAWSLVNLIRNFCDDFEVIVPSKCHSSGTIICLGANNVLMTKQATLGPIDPSTNGLFNPYVDYNNQRIKAPVSVENVNSYLELIKNELNITDQLALSNVIVNLTNHIHPIAIGEVLRSKTQIQMIAKKLLNKQGITDDDQISKIVNFLCSESGSHDYTIYRKEAHEELNLNVSKPSSEEYKTIKELYKNIEAELELGVNYDPRMLIGTNPSIEYNLKRGIIESVKGGCNAFITSGILTQQTMQQQTPMGIVHNNVVNDSRQSEGWQKIN